MPTSFSRRDFVRTAALAATTAVLADFRFQRAHAQSIGSAQLAHGTVFDDADHSGTFSSAKRGIPNVLVSNGRDIVRTNASGRYAISLPENRTLFIIKPRDWMTPISDTMLPRFYYHHYPTGTPNWRPDPSMVPKEAFDPKLYYPGIAPTGPMPVSIDFPLIHRPEPDRFRALVFGDPQPGGDDQVDWMGQTVTQELFGVSDIAFGITLGDVVNVGRLQYFDPVNHFISHIGVPWYNVLGNHDQNLMAPDDSLANITFENTYGPTTYAFEHGPVSFVVFKNIIRSPFTGFQRTPKGDWEPKGDDYTIGLQPDQWAFLENYLATVPHDKPLVLLMHAPIGIGRKNAASAYEERIFRLISGRPHTLSMSGHTHVQGHYFIGADRGFTGPGDHHHFNSICVRGAGYRGPLDQIQVPSCMAADGCEQGYSFVTFDGNRYDIEYKAARRPADHQMNIFLPRMVAANAPATPMQVNVFAGSPRSTVELRVSDGPPQRLKPAFIPDPAMVETLRLQHTNKPWEGPKYKETHPKNSHHVWEGTLPTNLPLGTHIAEVRTTDMFGKTYIARRPFRVVETVPDERKIVPTEEPDAQSNDT